MNKMQQTIRTIACLLTLAAACLASPSQTAAQTAIQTTTAPAPHTTTSDANSPTQSLPQPSLPQPVSLSDQIAALLSAPSVSRDHWGILVTTLDGHPIYALNEAQLFQPASTAKLFTTAAAMALMGENKRFTTQVEAEGKISGGTLHGNLYLVGGGDANFGGHDLPYLPPAERAKTITSVSSGVQDIEELAGKLYTSGLRVVEGDVVGDDSHFVWEPYPPEWALDDLIYGYAAPVSALSMHDNEIEVKVSPAADPSKYWDRKAVLQTDPDVPYYTIENSVDTSSTGFADDCEKWLGYRREQGTKNLLIYGNITPGESPCTKQIAVADPAEFAAIALKQALERRGIHISGTAKAFHALSEPLPSDTVILENSGTAFMMQHIKYAADAQLISCDAQNAGTTQSNRIVLATHESPPLSEDVAYTLKTSQNLHAEIMLRNLGATFSCQHMQKANITVLREFQKHAGIDKDDFVFYDGSGLSGHDLVTPRATARLLSYAAHDPKTGAPQPWFAAWRASLPVGGVDGTLTDRFTKAPLKGHVFAKTGTLGEARALAGYLDTASGQTVIFSILIGNHLPGSNADREVMDKIVAAIAAAE